MKKWYNEEYEFEFEVIGVFYTSDGVLSNVS